MSQNQAVFVQYPGGRFSSLNLTAATLIKPSPGILYRAAINAPGSTSGQFAFHDSNALVAAQTITGISVAANAVITLSTGGSTNPFAVGQTIAVTGAVGMTQINSVQGVVTAIGGVTTAWTVTTSINSTNFTAWASGGTAASFGAATLIWQQLYNATANVAGNVATLKCPCQNGILLASVPGAGSPIISAFWS